MAALIVVATTAAYSINRYKPNRLVTIGNPVDHFKYGSIGGDVENGLPVEVMKILPRAFPQYLPRGAPLDFTAFGFVQEPGHALPIGFSTRQIYVPVTGLTCSACHVATVRASVDSQPHVYLGMGARNMDLGAYFQFLFASAADERFTAAYLIPIMQANGAKLNVIDRIVYSRVVIPTMKKRLVASKKKFAPLFANKPLFGPGRIDTFNPYKMNQLAEHYTAGIPPRRTSALLRTQPSGTSAFAWGWR
jgi:hypothetical protein